MAWLTGLTQFGDLAVMIPLVIATFAWLLVTRAAWGAVWWAIAVCGCMSLTAFAKIAAYACPPAPDLHSPSGHTSLSTLVYGAVVLIAAAESRSRERAVAIAVGVCFILAIAVSRVVLGMHSVREVAIGLAIGTAALAVFGQAYLRHRPATARPVLYALLAAALMLMFHGSELRAEEFLHAISGYFPLHCP
jgi:membrane-associated phospholipid phosphatase